MLNVGNVLDGERKAASMSAVLRPSHPNCANGRADDIWPGGER